MRYATNGPSFPRIANANGGFLQAVATSTHYGYTHCTDYWSKPDYYWSGNGYTTGYLSLNAAAQAHEEAHWAGTVGGAGNVEDNLNWLAANNPLARNLSYVLTGASTDYDEIPDSWWKSPLSSPWPGQYDIDVTNRAAAECLLDACLTYIAPKSEIHGVALDYFDAETSGSQMGWLVQQLRATVPSMVIVPNTYSLKPVSWGGSTLATPTLAEYLDGVLCEYEINRLLAGTAAYQSAGWAGWFERYRWWQEHCRQPSCVIITTDGSYTGPPGWNDLTAVQMEAARYQAANLPVMRFSLAATLQGDGYHEYGVSHGVWWWYAEYDEDLGRPLQEFGAEQGDGTWRREFEHGTAICNPSGSAATVSFATPRRWRKTQTDGTYLDRISCHHTIPDSDGGLFMRV